MAAMVLCDGEISIRMATGQGSTIGTIGPGHAFTALA